MEVDRRRQFTDFMWEHGAGQFAIENVDVLDSMGFFTSPASTRFHGDYVGGLFDHSLEVAKALVDITEKMGLGWMDPRSPALIGMCHDLCKCDKYRKSNIPQGYSDVETPQKQVTVWEYVNKTLLSGHGDKSAMIAGTLTRLTLEEMLCIRYHMGAYEKDDWDGYDLAIKRCPNVLWTHTADMVASKIVGI